MKKKVVFFLMLLSVNLSCFAQTSIKGKVAIKSESERPLTASKKNKNTGEKTITLKAFKKDGVFKTEILIASVKLKKGDSVVYKGKTDESGNFEIKDDVSGEYQLVCKRSKSLKMDTIIYLPFPKEQKKMMLYIDAEPFWTRADSIYKAKYPYYERNAIEDIKNGKIYLLTKGLIIPILSDDGQNKITSKYGFKFFHAAGCISSFQNPTKLFL